MVPFHLVREMASTLVLLCKVSRNSKFRELVMETVPELEKSIHPAPIEFLRELGPASRFGLPRRVDSLPPLASQADAERAAFGFADGALDSYGIPHCLGSCPAPAQPFPHRLARTIWTAASFPMGTHRPRL